MIPAKGSGQLRKGRVSIAGQYYLLTTSTHEKRRVFAHPEAARLVLDSLHWFEKKEIINLEAAVVMPDHLHFVAELRSAALSRLMHSLKSYSSKQIKARIGYEGRIWQGQYHDHAIRKDEVLTDIIMYCLNNPVRARLVHKFHEYPYWYCRYEV